MPIFHYTARDAKGLSLSGEIEAPSKYEALSQLYARGLTVLGVKEGAGEAGGTPTMRARIPDAKIRKGWLVRRISVTEKALFCRQLSISVSSGISLREAIETIMTDQENLAFRDVLQRVMRGLDDGMPFSQAIAGDSKVFDRLFIALIKAAEESGSMLETLNYLAMAMEKSDKLARKIRSITAYPVFIGVFFIIVTAIMTLFVLPKFQDIFANFGGKLPLLTRMVLGGNRFILDNLGLILAGILAVVVTLVLYVRTPAGRMQRDRLLLRLPLIGELIRKVSVARFCRNFGIMIRGGVPVTTAITIASEVLGNRAMEETLRKTHDRIVQGNDIASSLDRNAFPRLAVRMVAIGESSGRMPEVLEKVADLYEDQVEGSIMVITSLFEPFIIIFFGCIILVLVMAVYLPVFTVAGTAR
jgi:type IV pilus assembly protein PilC